MGECLICKNKNFGILNLTIKGMVCITCCWKYKLKIYPFPLKYESFYWLPKEIKDMMNEFYLEDVNKIYNRRFKNKKMKIIVKPQMGLRPYLVFGG